jgi:hypothetical protein
MPVLVEAISVIVRREAIERKIAGGWDAFRKTVPNRTLCADEEIARVGFMSPSDTRIYIETLEGLGLRFLVGGEAVDIAVVDQLGGPTVKCRWLEFGRLTYGGEGRTIAACWLVESLRTGSKTDERPKSVNVEVPEGWGDAGPIPARRPQCPPKTT